MAVAGILRPDDVVIFHILESPPVESMKINFYRVESMYHKRDLESIHT